MCEYAEYTKAKSNEILKDGHKMFPRDIVKDLNRKSYLEKENKQQKETIEGLEKDHSDYEDIINKLENPWVSVEDRLPLKPEDADQYYTENVTVALDNGKVYRLSSRIPMWKCGR